MRRAGFVLLVAAVLTGCGAAEPKVVGGKPVGAGQLTAVVGLTYDGQRAPQCTGALIAPDMVLTAAHCVCDVFPGDMVIGHDPVASGRFYGLRRFRSASPCGTPSDQGIDLAVLQLEGEVGPEYAKPLNLADDTQIQQAQVFTVAGFGATDRDGTYTDYRKRHGFAPLTSPRCEGAGEAQRFGCEPGQEIVAGRRGSPDTCKGDSGSPLLVASVAAGVILYRIAGVTSRGVKGDVVCGDGGIYERIATQRLWIASTMSALRDRNTQSILRLDNGQSQPVGNRRD